MYLKNKFKKIDKKWIAISLLVLVIVGMLIFMKESYAYLYQILRGEKSYSLKVKGFSLKLDDSTTSENIRIENSEPISDEAGKGTNAYTFSIRNEDSSETGYIVYLDDVSIDNEVNRMKDTIVKYQLIENENERIGLVSELGTNPFRILTNGVIGGNQTNNYSLRFWIKEDAEVSAGQVFNVKIRIIATSKEAIAEGKLVFGDIVVTSDSGVTTMTSDELQTYVNKALGNKIETALNQKEKEILDKNHPIGSIYITETNQNPSEIFGGTWEQYGQGRTLIGEGTGNDGTTNKSFAIGAIGGEYNHTLTIDEMPNHTHIQNPHEHLTRLWVGGWKEWPEQTVKNFYVQNYSFGHLLNESYNEYTGKVEKLPFGSADTTTATNQNTGGSMSHNNIQPYITVYMWKRIE